MTHIRKLYGLSFGTVTKLQFGNASRQVHHPRAGRYRQALSREASKPPTAGGVRPCSDERRQVQSLPRSSRLNGTAFHSDAGVKMRTGSDRHLVNRRTLISDRHYRNR